MFDLLKINIGNKNDVKCNEVYQQNRSDKYDDDQQFSAFIQQFDQMQKLQKYTCLQVYFNTANRMLDMKKYTDAQQYIILAISLSQQNGFKFQEFDIPQLLKRAWLDRYNINSRKRNQLKALLKACNFTYSQEIETKQIKYKKRGCCQKYCL